MGESPVPTQALYTSISQGELMLVVMKAQATEEQVRAVCQKIEKLGYRAHSMPGATRTAIGITGNKGEVEQGTLEEMPGVQEVIQVSKPYKLVSRDVKEDNTVITFPGTAATIGGPGLAIVAGPCAIENHDQAFAVAERVHRAGAQFFRGGAYKPRTSPYSFQGLGEEGLRKILAGGSGRAEVEASIGYWRPRVAASFGGGTSAHFEIGRAHV